MTKYCSEPIVAGLSHLKAKLAGRYMDHKSDGNPRDFVRKEIAELPKDDLTHYFGILVSRDVDVSLNGSWASMGPTQSAVMFLAVYIWPYLCQDPRVEEKIRDSGHSGCLPVAVTSASS